MPADPIVDQTEKCGAHRLIVTTTLCRLGILKEACDTPEPAEKVASWADPVANLWPLDTVRQTAESAVSLMQQAEKMAGMRWSRCWDEVVKAAVRHDCLDVVGRVVRGGYLPATEKTASVDTDAFAAPTLMQFPIGTPDAIRGSITLFCEKRANYPWPWRTEIATNLLVAADENHLEVPESQRTALEKTAGRALVDWAAAARQTAWRAEKVASVNRPLARGLMKTALELTMLANSGADPGTAKAAAMASNLARALDEVDDTSDLRGSYGRGLSLPEDALFSMPISKVAAIGARVLELPNGNLYDKTEVAALPPEAFTVLQHAGIDGEGKLGTEKLATAVAEGKIASDVVDRVLNGFGVKPVSTSAPRGQAALVTNSEFEKWRQVAGEWGDTVELNGNELDFKLTGGGGLPVGRDTRGMRGRNTEDAGTFTSALLD